MQQIDYPNATNEMKKTSCKHTEKVESHIQSSKTLKQTCKRRATLRN